MVINVIIIIMLRCVSYKCNDFTVDDDDDDVNSIIQISNETYFCL